MVSKLVFRNAFVALRHLIRHGLAIYFVYHFYHRLTWPLFMLCALSTFWRLFCEHGCGHRYLSHKSYQCAPWFLQLMVITLAARDLYSPLFYWCFMHNIHHMHCDTGKDIHSPKHAGFWNVQLQFTWSADDLAGRFNIIDRLPENNPRNFKHLQTRYDADLSWLTLKRAHMIFLADNIFWIMLGVLLWKSGFDVLPFELFAWACVVPRLYTQHSENLTNSAAHFFGSQPYTGRPDSPYPQCEATNCWWVAWLNMGEGWHSNHHAYALSARHGLLWWEIDMVYYVLCVLGLTGVVWNMKVVDNSIRLIPRDQPLYKSPKVKYCTLFAK